MNKTTTIIIDGIETQTSLTGVEIAELVQRNKELEQQVKRSKEVIDEIEKYIKQCDWHDNDVYIGEDLLDILIEKDLLEEK